jgi:hypothetical protein
VSKASDFEAAAGGERERSTDGDALLAQLSAVLMPLRNTPGTTRVDT